MEGSQRRQGLGRLSGTGLSGTGLSGTGLSGTGRPPPPAISGRHPIAVQRPAAVSTRSRVGLAVVKGPTDRSRTEKAFVGLCAG